MAPLEPWEKVLVDAKEFPKTVHGHIACTDCHEGAQSSPDKEIAHENMIARPSEGDPNACSDCHPDVSSASIPPVSMPLSRDIGRYSTRGVHQRTTWLWKKVFNNHCSKCHASCGDCHVAQPASVGGGLFEGHMFTRTPPMTRSCTACHGSRVGNEYLGKNEGFAGDVHFREGRMNCVDCHRKSRTARTACQMHRMSHCAGRNEHGVRQSSL